MGPYLGQLQSGAVNVWVSDNTKPDWALYATTVATPKSDAVGAEVFIDGGGQARLDSAASGVGVLQVGGTTPGSLTLGAGGGLTLTQDLAQARNGSLVFEIGGATLGQYGRISAGDHVQLDGQVLIRTVNGFSPTPGSTYPTISTTGDVSATGLPNAVVRDLATGAVWGLDAHPRGLTATFVTVLFGDLTGDNALTVADWSQFKSSYNSSLSGAAATDAYQLGDLDGDRIHSLADFALFRDAFNAANGAGAFQQLLGVPEPQAGTLWLGGAACALVMRLRRRPR
jgi:hypothetical protein